MSAKDLTCEFPLRTLRGLNNREHWRGHAARARNERLVTTLAISAAFDRKAVILPCVVTLTRLSAGTMDDDGCQGAMKYVRDAVADWIGLDDGDVGRIRFRYVQEKCPPRQFGVRVSIASNAVLQERVIRRGKA